MSISLEKVERHCHILHQNVTMLQLTFCHMLQNHCQLQEESRKPLRDP
jgi:hypothetical protein